MRKVLPWLGLVVWLGLLPGLGNLPAAAREPNFLLWRAGENRVDARIDGWTLKNVLRRIGLATGWQVYLEPDTDRPVSAKFQNLNSAEALRFLLGDLNYALVPQTAGKPKLLVYRTSPGQATQLLPPARMVLKPGQPIPNELIVRLAGQNADKIEQLARQLRAKITGRVSGLQAYRLQFADETSTRKAREVLEGNPEIGQLDSNYAIERPDPNDEPAPALDRRFSLKPKPAAGNETVVALLDTPIQPLDPQRNSFLLPPVHVAGDAPKELDELTHGTTMAETILNGLASGPVDPQGSTVRVLPVDVYGKNDGTTSFDVANGIYTALQSGATIVNLSLGSDADSPFLRQVIHEAHQNGVTFLAAAGNEPTTAPTFPAAYPDVIAVTALDPSGQIAPYANRGGFVDAAAPGISLVHFHGQPYIVTGTSAATALLSGEAAAVRALGKSPDEVENYIKSYFSVRRQ